jgi:hypothetical protein
MSPSAAALLALFAAAAALTGEALARNWRPWWQLAPYALLLAIGDRFLLYALFGGTLLSPGGYAVAALILLIVAAIAYRATLARRMAEQYPWLCERTGPFTWRERR